MADAVDWPIAALTKQSLEARCRSLTESAQQALERGDYAAADWLLDALVDASDALLSYGRRSQALKLAHATIDRLGDFLAMQEFESFRRRLTLIERAHGDLVWGRA